MAIKLLDDIIINQIAAGEVVERPANVVKELIENSLDAGASKIQIVIAGGGKTLIRVVDNGHGIAEKELKLALSRHCTSKLDRDINNIRSLGLRGEALPSIASVAKVTLTSRTAKAGHASQIIVKAGEMEEVRPAAGNVGTTVEVCDLFYATPARLKFMKSERAENAAIIDTVKKIALAFPQVQFLLSPIDRAPLNFSATGQGKSGYLARIAQVLGKDFAENSVPIVLERNGITISGFTGLPSFNRGTSLLQFAYVNGRSIRDKLVLNAIRVAYNDVIPKDRHAAVVLFLHIDPENVDVNVHPTKADVRFRDPSLIRSLIIGSIREALYKTGIRPVSTHSQALLASFQTEPLQGQMPQRSPGQQADNFSAWQNHSQAYGANPLPQKLGALQTTQSAATNQQGPYKMLYENGLQNEVAQYFPPSCAHIAIEAEKQEQTKQYPLGAACGQIHKNYIIAQTEDSLILVDQHAAHERLIYEALKKALYEKPLAGQFLLIPEIVTLPQEQSEALLEHEDFLKKFGLSIEAFGKGTIIVRETPALLGEVDVQKLIRDLAEEALIYEQTEGVKKMIDHIAATMACHGSIRSGRILKAEEMNSLLRQMEQLPTSSTCNHGRPTYIELKLTDIERLFGRR